MAENRRKTTRFCRAESSALNILSENLIHSVYGIKPKGGGGGLKDQHFSQILAVLSLIAIKTPRGRF